MSKPSPKKTTTRPKVSAKGTDYARLLKAIESANTQMVGRAAAVVNQALVIRNWLIEAYLVEYEQGGADRAKYGARLLERLGEDLAKRSVQGCSADMLERMRGFFQTYPQFGDLISAPVMRKSGSLPPLGLPTISASVMRKSDNAPRTALPCRIPQVLGSNLRRTCLPPYRQRRFFNCRGQS